MIASDVRLLESVSRLAPFGVRFQDFGLNRPVSDGLRVRLQDSAGRLHEALQTPSGVFAVSDLPGLPALGFAATDDAFWQDVQTHSKLQRSFTVLVEDRLNRFLPFAFRVMLPVRGLVELKNVLPLTSNETTSLTGANLPLFSSPARPVPPSVAVVRTTLRQTNDLPAAWALLSVSAANKPKVTGLADHRGQVSLIFSYPPLPNRPMPPPEKGFLLSDQEWPLKVGVGFAAVPTVRLAESKYVDLYRVLRQVSGEPTLMTSLKLNRELNLVVPPIPAV
jgi:hypothetical protein